MTSLLYQLPQSGLPNSTEDPKVTNALTLIQNVINGNLDGSNVATTAGFYRLVPTTMGSNGTAAAGTLVGATPGVTVTLPAPAANIVVGVYAGVGATGANPVTVAGTNIYGVGLSAASSFKLGVPIAAVVLQSDGTNWFVVSGQQDTGWVPMTLSGAATYTATVGAFAPASRLIGDRSWLRGGFTYVSGSGSMATLAAPFRPAAKVAVAGPHDTGAAAMSITIDTGGVVTPQGTTSAYLDGSSYPVL